MVVIPMEQQSNVVALGHWLADLRGEEDAAAVVRRLARDGFDISSSYIGKLERGEVSHPGIGPLLALAEAYKGKAIYRGNRNLAFWDLWQRAGYPLPPTFPPSLANLADDPERFDEVQGLMDNIGPWRTDEIRNLRQNIQERRDRDAKRLQDPFVEPPITRIPGPS